MFEPATLATLATFNLPPRQSLPAGARRSRTSAAWYFYLDSGGRVVTATTTRHIEVIGETPDGSGFELVRDYDLSGR